MEYTMSPAQPETQSAMAPVILYAGFWRRVLAYLLDAILGWIVFFPLSLLMGVGMFGTSPHIYTGNDPEAASRAAQAALSALPGLMLFVLVEMVAFWLYCALMESSKNQGTLGKMALGLRVTDLDGNRITFGRATGRYFAKVLSSITLCIGFMMAGFTQKKQGLHDLVANTLVLRKQATVPVRVAQNAFQS